MGASATGATSDGGAASSATGAASSTGTSVASTAGSGVASAATSVGTLVASTGTSVASPVASTGASVATASVGHSLEVPSEVHVLLVSVGGGVSVDVPPSAYTIVGPNALKTKTATIVNDRRNARDLSNIDPPPSDKINKTVPL